MKPWMTWENVYQSVMCCEFSELRTTPCHSLMLPHVHIGTRPMASRMATCRASSPMIAHTQACGVMRPRHAAPSAMDTGDLSVMRLTLRGEDAQPMRWEPR
jgi:hypothetical protein